MKVPGDPVAVIGKGRTMRRCRKSEYWVPKSMFRRHEVWTFLLLLLGRKGKGKKRVRSRAGFKNLIRRKKP